MTAPTEYNGSCCLFWSTRTICEKAGRVSPLERSGNCMRDLLQHYPKKKKNLSLPTECYVILRINNHYFPNSSNRLVLLNRRQCLLCEIVTEFLTISRINIKYYTFLKTVCVSLFCTVLITHGYSYLATKYSTGLFLSIRHGAFMCVTTSTSRNISD